MTQTVKLADRTVLANFSVSRWGGHRADRKVTDEVHRLNDAKADTGNYNKRLLSKDASAKVDAAISAARIYYRMATMPWMDDGIRILPAANYMTYAARMKEFRQEFEQEVAAFIKAYPASVKEAKARLGKMFNEADYPPAAKLKELYRWEMAIIPFPDAADFRVATYLGDEYETVRADFEEKAKAIYENAMRDTGERITEVVARMKERLKAYKPGKPGKRAEGTFKDSLVENVRELAELLPSFNLLGDKKLAKIIETIQKDLCKHDAEHLRDDPKLCKKVAASADQVLSAVADFIA